MAPTLILHAHGDYRELGESRLYYQALEDPLHHLLEHAQQALSYDQPTTNKLWHKPRNSLCATGTASLTSTRVRSPSERLTSIIGPEITEL